MSGPTIRIDEVSTIPEVSFANDGGNTIEITNIHDFDLGLLGNQRKITSTPPRSASPGVSLSEIKEVDNIEFVSLDDTTVKYDIKPPVNNGSSADTIKIIRDNNASPPKPIEFSQPSQTSSQPTGGWFSKIAGNTATNSGGASGGGISSWFAGDVAKPVEQSTASYLPPEQEAIKKTEGLTLLERMDRKGIGGTKMTMANTLEEINAEVARRKDSKGLEASIRFQRSMLTTVTSGLEFLNNRYDPLGVALDGWSEQVNENIEDYDEIFEELYDKYKDKSKVAPEVRLVMSLGLSAAMCHVTNTMFKSRMPGMDDILRKNPELAKQMARAAAEQAVGPGFANFVSMGMSGGPSRQPPPPQQYEESNHHPFMESPPATARREMRGPTGVEDILNTLNSVGELPSRAVPTPAVGELEETGSVLSGMTTDTMRRQGLSRKRKNTTQPTGATLTLNV